MVRVVGIHEIAQQYQSGPQRTGEWLLALRGGLEAAGFRPVADQLTEADLRVAFFGDLFRPPGSMADDAPPYAAKDLGPGRTPPCGRSRGRPGQTRRSALWPDHRTPWCSPGLTPDLRIWSSKLDKANIRAIYAGHRRPSTGKGPGRAARTACGAGTSRPLSQGRSALLAGVTGVAGQQLLAGEDALYGPVPWQEVRAADLPFAGLVVHRSSTSTSWPTPAGHGAMCRWWMSQDHGGGTAVPPPD